MSDSKLFTMRYFAQAYDCDNSMDDYKEFKRAALQFTSGGLASLVEVCVVYPLDLIKTRLQLQGDRKPADRYDGAIDCIKKMYKQEGPFSFYKGILIPLLSEAPKRAIKFVLYEQFQRLLLFNFEMKTATPLIHSASGFVAGAIEGIIVTPFEVVKLTLQANRALVPPSIVSVAKDIIRKDGLGVRGINKGLIATASRNGAFNMVYFGVYYGEKDYIAEYKVDTVYKLNRYHPNAKRLFPENPWQEFVRKFSSGFMSGIIAIFFSSPLDMAKARIQGPQPDIVKYKTTFATIRMIVKEEGFLTLYTGMHLKIVRIGIGGALMMAGYDYIYKYLVKNFLDS